MLLVFFSIIFYFCFKFAPTTVVRFSSSLADYILEASGKGWSTASHPKATHYLPYASCWDWTPTSNLAPFPNFTALPLERPVNLKPIQTTEPYSHSLIYKRDAFLENILFGEIAWIEKVRWNALCVESGLLFGTVKKSFINQRYVHRRVNHIIGKIHKMHNHESKDTCKLK